MTGPVAEMYAAHVRATYGTVHVGPVTGMAVMLTHGRTGIVLNPGSSATQAGDTVLLSASGIYYRRRRPTGPVSRA